MKRTDNHEIIFFLANFCITGYHKQRKHAALLPPATEISWNCGNFQLIALNVSLICCLKEKYDRNFNYIDQFVHLNAHSNPLKGIFSDKLPII